MDRIFTDKVSGKDVQRPQLDINRETLYQYLRESATISEGGNV